MGTLFLPIIVEVFMDRSKKDLCMTGSKHIHTAANWLSVTVSCLRISAFILTAVAGYGQVSHLSSGMMHGSKILNYFYGGKNNVS